MTLEWLGGPQSVHCVCSLCDVWVILGAVQRGAISRLLAKISEAEAMMNQVCTCVFVYVCVCGGGGCVCGVCVCVCVCECSVCVSVGEWVVSG